MTDNKITPDTAENLAAEKAAVEMLLAMAKSTRATPVATAEPPAPTSLEDSPEDDLPSLIAELKDLTSQVKTLEVTLQIVSARLTNVRRSISLWLATNLPEQEQPKAQPVVVAPSKPKPKAPDNSIIFDKSAPATPGGTPALSAEVAAVQRLGGIVL